MDPAQSIRTPPVRLAARPETADDDPLITQLMTADVITVAPDTGVGAALREMIRHHVRHLAVLDGTHCGGVVTETAVIRAIADDLVDARAGDLCRPLPEVRHTQRRSDAARRMRDDDVDAVLVVDGTTVRGIVTATDIIASLVDHATARHTQTPVPGTRYRR